MAILNGIKVAIVVNGQELKEYDDEDDCNDDQNSVSKYVEATSDAEFGIMTSATWYQCTSDAVKMDIYLDGKYVQNFIFRKGVAGRTRSWQYNCKGAKRFDGNQWESRPFRFVEITTVENDIGGSKNTTKSDSLKNLGTICIEFRHLKSIRKFNLTRCEDDKKTAGLSVLTEKELKGKSLTHGVALGKAQKVAEVLTFQAVDLDGENSPVAKFTFRYCSRKALQDLLVIPRTPSPPREPTPLPLEERNIEDLTPEEMRELIRRQRDAIKNEASVKREGTKAERGIKREHDDEYDEIIRSAVSKKAKTHSFEHGETIELD